MLVATYAHTGKMNEIQWRTCGKYKICMFIYVLLRDYINLIYRGLLEAALD